MAGTINQSSIEAVFEDVMNDSVEKMSEEDREDARKFHLSEAVRFGAVDYLEGRDYIPSRTDEEIEGMNRVEKMFMQQYYLTEAKRFGADESYTIRDPEEEEEEEEVLPTPAPRQRPAPAPRQRPVPAPRAEVEEEEEEEEEEDDDEERRFFREESARKCEDLRECIKSIREENAQIEERSSLSAEFVAYMKHRNVIMREERRINNELVEAEKEWEEIHMDN